MAKKVWKRDFEEMESRNFLIAMQTGYEGQSWKKAKDENVELIDSIRGYRLWGLEGFRKYSRKVSWFVSIGISAERIAARFGRLGCPERLAT